VKPWPECPGHHDAAKHAGASEVTILLSQEGPRIQLKVSDGVGIEPGLGSRGKKRREGGLGLLGIRESAAAFVGRLRVGHRPGGGTIVQVVVYLKAASV
jgi:signal transduction histidine kinase